MASFHVYVDGPTDRSPDGLRRLAEAISRSYGLPAADLTTRLTAGRFRVKANVDRATADTYGKALEQLGARVTIEEAHPTQPVPVTPAVLEAPRPRATMPPSVTPPTRSKEPSLGAYSMSSPARSAKARGAASTPPPTSAARPSTPSLPPANAARPSTPSLPPANAARPSTPSLPPANAARPSTPQPFVSGLSAAFDQQDAADLGALGDESFKLSSLDGNEDNSPSVGSFDAPSPGMPASIGPAALPVAPVAAKPVRSSDTPLDLFAPPDAEEAEALVQLAPDEIEHRARKLNTPPAGLPVVPPPAEAEAARASSSSLPSMRRSAPIPVEGGVSSVDAREIPRVRFAAGVLLSIVLGFLPAHLIASMREDSAYATIDAQVHATQLQADTPEMYAQLDAFRAAQLSRKESDQRSIAMTSMLIWGIVAAGLAYVWFRRVPWDRLGSS